MFILLVEKDAAFMRLAEDRFYNTYPCIIITAKGQPDVATRCVGCLGGLLGWAGRVGCWGGSGRNGWQLSAMAHQVGRSSGGHSFVCLPSCPALRPPSCPLLPPAAPCCPLLPPAAPAACSCAS